MIEVPVLIVGGGPVGWSVAIRLSRFGRRSRILGSMDQPILGRADAEPDPVVEAFKQPVDRSLIRETLRRSVQERFQRRIERPP